MSDSVPAGLFLPGGRTGIVRQPESPIVPIEWIKAHPATRRWWAKVNRTNVPAGGQVDPALTLPDGFEAYIAWIVLLGKADVQGVSVGTSWKLLLDRVAQFQTSWITSGVTLDSSGSIDYLEASDGAGRSWGNVDVWVPEGSVVAMSMNNNGGTADVMGWVMYGFYWPVIIRDQWLKTGWRGKS